MFVNRIVVALELVIDGSTFAIPAGNVKNFALDLDGFGFRASADFWLVSLKDQSEDELFAKFIAKDLIEAKLTLDRTYDRVGETADPLVVTGIVTDKGVAERSFDELSGQPVLQRHYRVSFEDRAAVLWRQHFPTELHVDATLKSVVEANKPKGLALKVDFAPFDVKHPVLALGLGAQGNAASFYDYLLWLLDARGGGLWYDAGADQYSLAGSKPSGREEDLPLDDVAQVETYFPETSRALVSVLNGYSEAQVKTKQVDNADKVAGVRRDHLMISALGDDLKKRADLEGTRSKAKEPEVHLEFARFPSITFKPAMTIGFGEDWSGKLYQHGKKYRVSSLRICARAERQGASDDVEDDSNEYAIEYRAVLELKTDPVFRLPAHERPRFPFYVEGKVVSEQGQAGEGTYQAYKDSKTSIEYYKVAVPLFADKKVIVAYNANLLGGHFYFPVYKDARVLVSLEHDQAWISRFLDWRPGAKLPQTTQGNQILFGKKAKDQTSVAHVYADAKPKLTIQRTYQKDTQVIEISEGTIRLSTSESKT